MSTTVEEVEKTNTSEDKKSELLLDSLEIKGYRCFEHLTIEKLGRVNLIVGKNNVGKTALLEALWLYAEASSWRRVIKLLNHFLEKRREKEKDVKSTLGINIGENSGLYFRHLFYKRPVFDQNDKNRKVQFFIDSGKTLEFNKHFEIAPKDYIEINGEYVNDSLLVTPYSTDPAFFHHDIKSLFVDPNGLDLDLLTEIWDDSILKNEEDEVVKALTIISDEIMDLNFINYPKGSGQRVPVVRTQNIKERVPLSSLGEGMNRLLGIALALGNCKNGILLVDEIEIGLHYSVLPDVWKLIFKTARDLNVQVFATTHSKDCIEAFTQAAVDDKESNGILIRLENKNGAIKAVNFNEDELETVERRNIEVR